jgi:hypothetical protein
METRPAFCIRIHEATWLRFLRHLIHEALTRCHILPRVRNMKC